MAISKPITPADRDLPVHCEVCGWRSIMRHARSEMNDVVRCPECGQPVIVDPDKLKSPAEGK